MANKLIYSSTNPLQLFLKTLVRDERYNSKDFEDFDFPETIRSWEQQCGFCQPWQLNDTIQIQLQTNVGPVNAILKDCKRNTVIHTIGLTQRQESETEPGLFIYELTMPLNIYDSGCFYIDFEFGVDPLVFTLRTGELNFEELHENSLLLEYKHFENKEDLIYETGIYPSVRTFGNKKFVGAKTKNTTFEDQVLNSSMLRAQKYRMWKMLTGKIPDYFQDMLAGVLTCSTLSIDGKFYTEASEMEPTEAEGYPMRSWSSDMRERYSRGSRTFENDIPVNAVINVAVSVDSKGFGNSNSGNETIIIDVI